MTNCNANAMNSIAKLTNSTAKPTNSIAKAMNSIAKTCKKTPIKTSVFVCLPDYGHKAGCQMKQSTATILCHNNKLTKSPVGCAFWGSDECVPSFPFIFNQVGHCLLHAMKPY